MLTSASQVRKLARPWSSASPCQSYFLEASRSAVWGLGSRVEGFGVQGVGLRVWGLGFRV